MLTRYSGADRQRIRLALGGLGTGCISIDGRGRLVDVEVANNPAKGLTPRRMFFTLRCAGTDGHVDTRVLEGDLFDHEYEGAEGSTSPQHGFPRFRDCEFGAAYPFATVELADPAVPLEVRLEAVNPLVPEDLEASGHPALLYRVRVRNTSAVGQQVSIAASLPSVIGATASEPAWRGARFTAVQGSDGTVITGRHSNRDGSPADGTIALHSPGRIADSSRTSWIDRPWGDALSEFWADFAGDGQLTDHPAHDNDATCSLVLSEELASGAEATFDFVIGWHFPYRKAWNHWPGSNRPRQHVVGNHYTTVTADAGEAAVSFGRALDQAVAASAAFVRSIIDSDLPAVMADAALSNLAILKSPTVFRTADGRFYGWEGCLDDAGSCHGTCTHVWNYEYATVSLFPELAWSMRETEFVDSLCDDRGMLGFRTGLPRELEGPAWDFAAADGQMGAVIRFYRTWRRTGDEDRMRTLWPYVRKAVEFAWIPGGWDADRDGVMEGCQHNTTDVEYYGPSMEVQSWYLGALAAATEIADHLGETDFAAECRRMLHQGCAWCDEHLFNGDYYAQDIRPPGSADVIARGLRLENIGEGGSRDLSEPDYQIGSGCTSDQLAGVSLAQISGLQIPLDPDHVRTALLSIAEHNYIDDFAFHVNPRRSYALGREHGLLNASYPNGQELAYPFPYAAEVWPGFEYSAAVGLLLIGEDKLAQRTVADVRDRHSGRRRNPFDEAECGYHYVRSMASWGLVEAWRLRHHAG